MQTVTTLPATVCAGYVGPDLPTVLQDAYSLPTAQTLAKRLAQIGKDKRFWIR